MPIGPELLNPIPGENPAGANLKYDPVYDKIKEARREDDDTGPQGEWGREFKKADWPVVVKLSCDLLANKTKDLQLAAWLTEALVKREGYAGLKQGLELCRGLVEQFWDNLYPEAEDGEYESRATPLDWIGGRLADPLKHLALTKSGLDWFKYKESRSIGYEADVASSDSKREARELAIADGKLTPEEFDKAFEGTPKTFYQNRLTEIDACLEAVSQLSQVCDAKFGEFNPSFSGLRDTLEEIRQAANTLLAKKRETEPDEGAEPAAELSEQGAEEPTEEAPAAGTEAGASARPKGKKTVIADPTDRADAYARVTALAAWLRREDPYNPVPYVMVRALRWGELRAAGSDIDANLLEPPATAQRTEIKRLFNEGNYEQLFPVMEAAAAEPCGRGWLDLQRFFCNACDNAGGYDYVKNAVLAELKALLADYPGLPKMTLLDDTPTANPETLAWLEPLLHRAPEPTQNEAIPDQLVSAAGEGSHATGDGSSEPAPPDVYELAKQAVKRGQTDEAIGMLAREVALERCGRSRFLRQVQLAQICLSTNHEVVAFPILQGLSDEIESRKLEGWEQPDLLAQALSLLYRCSSKLKDDPELKQKLYARICRLDPVLALDLKQ